MAATDKDTIYIDIDDEITGIIDKVKASEGKVVALVLPKRASVFQSIVNMKLLKRAADSSKKHLVLITSEAGLLPLAGAAGVHVAKTLTSKPEIPSAPIPQDNAEEEIAEDDIDETATPVDKTKTLGQLAGAGAAADGMETLELDNEEPAPETSASEAIKKPAPKKDKKLAVPNFDRFRLLLVGGISLLILLIIGFIFAASALPKATITIKTDAVNINSNLKLNLSTTAQSLDPSNNTLPAKLATEAKTFTASVATTGKKNNGNKATGTVSMVAKKCSGNPFDLPADVPAGSGLSANGKTYITQENTSFGFAGAYTSGGCSYYPAGSSTDIAAQNAGQDYNTSGGTSFDVSGRPEVSATGSAAGGTDNIVQVVSQSDIDNAKGKIKADDSSIKDDLKSQLSDANFYAILATYNAASPSVTTSNNVGDAANNVTVTETIKYNMFGVHKDDLKTVVENDIKSQIDTSKQAILDNGIDSATYNVDSVSDKSASLTMDATAEVGPDLDKEAIKAQAAGKKPGEVKDAIRANPDVTDVQVKLSPFWVSSVPKKTSKINVVIAKPATSAKASSDASNP